MTELVEPISNSDIVGTDTPFTQPSSVPTGFLFTPPDVPTIFTSRPPEAPETSSGFRGLNFQFPDRATTVFSVGPPRPPGPPKPPEPGQPESEASGNIIDKYVRARARILNKDLSPEQLARQVREVDALCKDLTPDEMKQFLRNTYVMGNLEEFLPKEKRKTKLDAVESKKIALALQVNNLVSQDATTHGYEKQFIPAVNVASFVVLEGLDKLGLGQRTVYEALYDLKEKLGDGTARSWGEESMMRHSVAYLSKMDGTRRFPDAVPQLVEVIGKDLNKKLSQQTQEMSWTGQSQGIEVEVLTHVRNSPNALKKGVDPKWLPRGVPISQHERTDWNLLPLLGVNEDVGERKYQIFEMSTDPSETAATQSTLAFMLMSGGFITERNLSGSRQGPERAGREAFSLHVSTAFPRDIMNKSSIKEYKDMARALALAFASDQRISFGGFMSGGAEISDKTMVGNLKDVGGSSALAAAATQKERSLVEIRNLDLTLRGQYSALLHKEVLDFAFRCSWQQAMDPDKIATPLEAMAAQEWVSFRTDLHQLLASDKYRVSPAQLYRKYGKSWEKMAWKDLADTRTANPELQDQVSRLIREHTGRIRRFQKETSAEVREEEPKGWLDKNKYVSTEPLSQREDRVYLSAEQRDALGVALGDIVVIRHKGKTRGTFVAPAKQRGGGQVEGTSSDILRFSPNILNAVGFSNGVLTAPTYNAETKEIVLDEVERTGTSVINESVPRAIRVESLGQQKERFYMTAADRKKFGVAAGSEVMVRFGATSKKVVIAESKKREDGSIETPESGNWRLSADIIGSLAIPDGAPLRMQYDKDIGEFSFGPSMVHFNKVSSYADGQLKIQGGTTFFRQAAQQAEQYGVFLCLADPNAQTPEDLDNGVIKAYTYNAKSKTWSQVTVPIPDVAHDKDVSASTATKRRLREKIGAHIVSVEQLDLTGDKLEFAKVMSDGKLKEFQPETINLSEENEEDAIAAFTELSTQHDGLILKPRYGQRGKGLMVLTKKDGVYNLQYTTGDENNRSVFSQEFDSPRAVATFVREFAGDQKYVAQERIPLYKFKQREKNGKGEIITRVRTPEVRVTVQRGIDGAAVITGMVVRLLDPTLKGEEFLEKPEKVFKSIFGEDAEMKLDEFRNLGVAALKKVEAGIKTYSGEIAFDIGIKDDGNPVIIEANSKAETRGMYAERVVDNQDAVHYSTARPIEYALHLTNMT